MSWYSYSSRSPDNLQPQWTGQSQRIGKYYALALEAGTEADKGSKLPRDIHLIVWISRKWVGQFGLSETRILLLCVLLEELCFIINKYELLELLILILFHSGYCVTYPDTSCQMVHVNRGLSFAMSWQEFAWCGGTPPYKGWLVFLWVSRGMSNGWFSAHKELLLQVIKVKC